MIRLVASTQSLLVQKIEKASASIQAPEIVEVVNSLREVSSVIDLVNKKSVSYFANAELQMLPVSGPVYELISAAQHKLTVALSKVKQHRLHLDKSFLKETADLLLKCENNLLGISAQTTLAEKFGETIVSEYKNFFSRLSLQDQDLFCEALPKEGKPGVIYKFFFLQGQVMAIGLDKKQEAMEQGFQGRFDLGQRKNGKTKNNINVEAKEATTSYYESRYREYYFPNAFPNYQDPFMPVK